MNTELPIKYMDGSWKPSNNMIVKVDIDAFIDKDKLDELNVKIVKLVKKAQEAEKKMNAFSAVWDYKEKEPNPIEKIAMNLARCASKLYGPNNVLMDWHSNLQTMSYTLGIRVTKPGNINGPLTQYQWVQSFTEDFLWKWSEGGTTDEALQDTFLILLKDMCKHFRQAFQLTFALPVSFKMWQQEDPWDELSHTTQDPYVYLREIKFIDKIISYWNTNIDSPIMKSFYAETGYDTGLWLSENEFKGGETFAAQPYLGNSGTLMKSICPALNEIVKLPCGCLDENHMPLKNRLEKVIIHLNDRDEHMGVKKEWSREEIADWLESLDVDLTLRDNSTNDTEKEN